jgi:AcrR family transcriptional regulator
MKIPKRKATEDRKNQIISVAIEIFFESGYQKASLRDIGRRVGVTQAAIYYHFRNKEEILYSIIEDISNQLLFSLIERLSKDKDPVKRLGKAILIQIGLMKKERKKVKILIEDKKLLGTELQRLVKEKERTIYNFYLNTIKEIKQQGKLKDIELTTAVFAIIGQINWLYHWYRPEGKLDIEEIAENLVKMIMLGLIKE